MNTYKDVLKVADKIEKEFNTKCYLCGKGVRKLLKRQDTKRKHYVLVIEPKKNISFNSLKSVFGEKILNDNGIIKLSDITVYITPLNEYLSKFDTDIQKAYIDTDKNISLKGKGLIDTRKRLIRINNKREVVKNCDRLSRVLELRYEGFYLNQDDTNYIARNIDENSLITAYKRAIQLKSPNMYRTVMGDFRALNRLMPFYKTCDFYVDVESFPCYFMRMIDSSSRSNLNRYLSDMFFEYGDKITKATGLTELNFFNSYDVVSYLNILQLLDEGKKHNMPSSVIKDFVIKLGYSDERADFMVNNCLNFKETICPNLYLRTCSYRTITRYYSSKNFALDGSFITALIVLIGC